MADLRGSVRRFAAGHDFGDRGLRIRTRSARPLAVYCIYRRRNAARVADLVRPLEPAGVHLWALDDADPGLAAWTRGSGPGGKFALLRGLLTSHPPQPGAWTVLLDDDVTLRRGDLSTLVDLADRSGFLLAQPAHAPGSFASHTVTVGRPWTLSRVSGFVEIGPVVAVAPAFVPQVVESFPEDMGWGLEIDWLKRAGSPAALGVIDAVVIGHEDAVAADYSGTEADRFLRARLADAGLTELSDLFLEGPAWRVWQHRPSWV